MKFNASYWIRFSLVNLLVVALLGGLMRYKIGFDFPYLMQKNIQHAHSHFAFSGWIAHTIYVLLITFITEKIPYHNNLSAYTKLLICNLICSYGMLISFFVSGYSFVSIAFSLALITNNVFMMYYVLRDFKKIESYHPSVVWFKTAMWFNLISSIGTFYLAYMMASKNFNEHLYLAAIYFYLHFQYNGFFIFSCMGLVINKLPKYFPAYTYNKKIFILFFASCIPAYFLSVLWAKLPVWLYAITVASAFVQVGAWLLFLKEVRHAFKQPNTFPKYAQFMFVFVGIAFSIKLLLQLGSTIPEVSKLAFGFRPVVIAYLHLVLLAVISVFLLAYLFAAHIIQVRKETTIAFTIFLIGVFLNELALAIQGVASFAYLPIPYINEALFVIALNLVVGAALILFSQKKKKYTLRGRLRYVLL
ncbi:MAG: hypothetical protein JST67_00930 [Bacteroidetes bacterium]|nr:hypothetical protein [Bacteroidota bacterium]